MGIFEKTRTRLQTASEGAVWRLDHALQLVLALLLQLQLPNVGDTFSLCRPCTLCMEPLEGM